MRPEIKARGGVYPATDLGRVHVLEFHDALEQLVPERADKVTLLKAHLGCLIEQHNASWDAAVIDCVTAPREPAKNDLKEPPHGA